LGRPVWLFSAATTVALTGTFIQKVAVGWSVREATHATTWLAAASLADLLPTLVVSIPAGALVDRFQGRSTTRTGRLAIRKRSAVSWGAEKLSRPNFVATNGSHPDADDTPPLSPYDGR